jgi:hypothetical protein
MVGSGPRVGPCGNAMLLNLTNNRTARNLIIIIIIIIIMDVAIPLDRNVLQKEAEEKFKYKNLSTEIQRLCNVKTLCHTGNNWGHRNCKQKFTKMSGNNTRTTLNRFLTKNCLLGTSHIIRKVLQAET